MSPPAAIARQNTSGSMSPGGGVERQGTMQRMNTQRWSVQRQQTSSSFGGAGDSSAKAPPGSLARMETVTRWQVGTVAVPTPGLLAALGGHMLDEDEVKELSRRFSAQHTPPPFAAYLLHGIHLVVRARVVHVSTARCWAWLHSHTPPTLTTRTRLSYACASDAMRARTDERLEFIVPPDEAQTWFKVFKDFDFDGARVHSVRRTDSRAG